MMISNGISEIRLHQSGVHRTESERIFVWPLYNAGKVEKIHGVTRHTESNAMYAKPSGDDREKILSMSAHRSEVTYTPRGDQKSHLMLQPGSLFDAVV